MKNIIISLLLCAAAMSAQGATNAPPSAPLAGVTCAGSSCTGSVNGPTVPFYVSGTSGSDPTKLALDASIQSLITILNAPLSLPSGAATSALQTTANTSLASILAGQATAANQVTANGYLSTLATFSTSAATSAKQDTGNTSLAAIVAASASQATAANQTTSNTNTGNTATGVGATSDTAYAGSGNASAIAVLKGLYAKQPTSANPTYTLPGQATTVNPDISTITTGGTAVNAIAAGHCKYGCYLLNPLNATQNLCANDTGAASGTQTNAGTICGGPGQQLSFSPTGSAISAVSSDSAHPFGGKGSM